MSPNVHATSRGITPRCRSIAKRDAAPAAGQRADEREREHGPSRRYRAVLLAIRGRGYRMGGNGVGGREPRLLAADDRADCRHPRRLQQSAEPSVPSFGEHQRSTATSSRSSRRRGARCIERTPRPNIARHGSIDRRRSRSRPGRGSSWLNARRPVSGPACFCSGCDTVIRGDVRHPSTSAPDRLLLVVRGPTVCARVPVVRAR